ncbi:MAG TPA: response regulator transcription factor [Pseudolabrys sp.]|nr:response regulator transcription factor [Pseudolabrys sp.]
MPKNSISIVVADDHPVVLHGVAGVLRIQADMTILAACTDGASAVSAIRQFAPDVAVLDIAMPSVSGLDVLSSVTASGLDTKVIFLTALATDDQILTAIANGAKGIVLKDAAFESLVACVREVAAGRQWFPVDLVETALRRDTQHRAESRRFVQRLTEREQEIVLLVAEGLSNKEIARRINLTEGTIKIHLHNIYDKLEVPNRTALTALAITYQHQFRS